VSPRSSLPLADAHLLGHAARRTAIVRWVLAVLLSAALAAGVFLVAHSERQAVAGGNPKHTIVVLDLSGSISGPASARSGFVLRSLAANDPDRLRVGLVLFSDVAQEALPPDTKPAELLPYARYFPAKAQNFGAPYPDNPWATSFSSGTTISRGLALARRLVARDHLGTARVVLVSDLFDADADYGRLKAELLAYARTPGLELRVQPLAPDSSRTLQLFTRYLGERRVALTPRTTQRVEAAGAGSSFPIAFVALVCVLAVAVGANELVASRFRWQEPPR
jgi:hypothetical protein